MNKFVTIVLITLYLIPQNVKSQKNNNAEAAVAVASGIGAIAAAIVAIEQMKEQVELEATQYILSNFPEYDKFLLSTLDFDGKKMKDMSSTSVITFKMRLFDFDYDQKKPKPVFGKNMVLFAFTSRGWVNQYGVDYSKIQWHLISRDEWTNMMTSYSKLASKEEDDEKIKNILRDGYIVNKGIRDNKGKNKIDFYKIGGDMYLVTDYSEEFKFVYNERSFGMYLKKTKDLVQIGRNDLIKIHNFLFDDTYYY